MTAGNWSFLEDDFQRITRELSQLTSAASARTTLLVELLTGSVELLEARLAAG